MEEKRTIAWQMQDAPSHCFDTVYSALSTRMRSGLAIELGAEANANGTLFVGRDQQTSVPGLYAAGDGVSGLSQISVVAGHAAIATTHMNASLPFQQLRR